MYDTLASLNAAVSLIRERERERERESIKYILNYK